MHQASRWRTATRCRQWRMRSLASVRQRQQHGTAETYAASAPSAVTRESFLSHAQRRRSVALASGPVRRRPNVYSHLERPLESDESHAQGVLGVAEAHEVQASRRVQHQLPVLAAKGGGAAVAMQGLKAVHGSLLRGQVALHLCRGTSAILDQGCPTRGSRCVGIT
ncbi:Protein of unknown function [Gryllus bimaculatus]|nr:Protein of unknown function [Gryllus bimaculatus]